MRDNKTLYLVCNAHLDLVWQWEWHESLAEALSTFRIAAAFCETYDGFIFNHNEAKLYQWIEEYDPPLFQKIQDLVQKGKWHIMGGWYLQPDCVMSSGESIFRQMEKGLNYFREKFGCRPRTAINVDSFGHDRGLVQLLLKSGYTSYLVGRPSLEVCKAPGPDFLWEGYDGTCIPVHLAADGYNVLWTPGDRIGVVADDPLRRQFVKPPERQPDCRVLQRHPHEIIRIRAHDHFVPPLSLSGIRGVEKNAGRVIFSIVFSILYNNRSTYQMISARFSSSEFSAPLFRERFR